MFIMFGIGIINFFVFDVLDFDLVSFGKNAPLFFYAGLSLMVGVPFNIWLWNRTIKGAVRDFTWQNNLFDYMRDLPEFPDKNIFI